MPWRTDRRRGAGSSLAERASCVSTLLGRVLMTTLCNWLALGQGECQKFIPGEHLPRRDMLIVRGGRRAHGHHAHPWRRAWDMSQRVRNGPRDMLIVRGGRRAHGHQAHPWRQARDMSQRVRNGPRDMLIVRG